jgi:NAD(P)-dependent dehydrogenase (short-subunit alcohol dehydrogenase family)
VAGARTFGPIHGLIHAAGVAGGGILQLKERDAAARVMAPKVEGTLVLESVLRDEPLDFVLLCSSVASLVGGFGQVDYCAANAFLDAYALRAASSKGLLTLSVNWDAWREVGMAVNTAVPARSRPRELSLKVGIAPRKRGGVLTDPRRPVAPGRRVHDGRAPRPRAGLPGRTTTSRRCRGRSRQPWRRRARKRRPPRTTSARRDRVVGADPGPAADRRERLFFR